MARRFLLPFLYKIYLLILLFRTIEKHVFIAFSAADCDYKAVGFWTCFRDCLCYSSCYFGFTLDVYCNNGRKFTRKKTSQFALSLKGIYVRFSYLRTTDRNIARHKGQHNRTQNMVINITNDQEYGKQNQVIITFAPFVVSPKGQPRNL